MDKVNTPYPHDYIRNIMSQKQLYKKIHNV